MCLLLIAHRAVPGYRLVVAANRDEFHGRPTAPADAWEDHPHIVGGRDLEGGGTWLALHRDGRFATVTNVRAGHAVRRGPRSRGLIVTDFLLGAGAAPDYAAELAPVARDYDGFNLLAWDGDALSWVSNQGNGPRTLARGVYTLSNALLDTPWPKTERLRRAFDRVMRDVPADPVPSLLAILRDNAPADDDELPDTGIGQARERWLSSIFIEGETYGTRCSTVLTVADDGRVRFHERRYDARAQVQGDSRHDLTFATGTAAA
ncbi:MAG: NRDE family protein [Gammaproteobacteria bacterium]|nr:NRDE family protein [Gammaproteobacteria bacterium]